ncbi:DUF2088 domain-containing protein [bacterium LRH843]|nr:DUF2088 domain-containing protein [bacterium LRH843]
MIDQIEMYEVVQKFQNNKIHNIKEHIDAALRNNAEVTALSKGAEIAITAGSRGISNIPEILSEIVSVLKDLGHNPFLVPAMGSHGGSTAEGQIEVLQHLGITEETIGAEIRSSMEVELITHTKSGVPVYMDKHAYHADGIIIVNRIKAHTAFRGKVESGLSKMITIGLGKKMGASFVHSNGALKMAENIADVSESALKHSPILMGIAIVENGYDETAEIVGVTKDEWFKTEGELLERSKKMMPRLPLDNIDLLIVEEMGKIFSGTGMDPNIIGRWRIEGVPEPKTPNIHRIAVLDLAERSFGNAQGVGLADFTTQRLVDRIDRKATYTNAITSTYLQRAMLPFIYDSERTALEAAIGSLGPSIDPKKAKIIQIPNTLHLDTLLVSKPVLEEMQELGVEFTTKSTSLLAFNENNELTNRLTVYA